MPANWGCSLIYSPGEDSERESGKKISTKKYLEKRIVDMIHVFCKLKQVFSRRMQTLLSNMKMLFFD
jgi:hypothetical protein